MSASVDITGRRYNRLTALRYDHSQVKTSRKGETRHFEMWWFRCDCGTERLLQKTNVTGGLTQSCGCLRRQNCKAMIKAVIAGQVQARRDSLFCTEEEAKARPRANMLTGIFPIVLIKRSTKGRIVTGRFSVPDDDETDDWTEE